MKEDEDTYMVVVERLDGVNTFTLMKHKLLRHTHE